MKLFKNLGYALLNALTFVLGVIGGLHLSLMHFVYRKTGFVGPSLKAFRKRQAVRIQKEIDMERKRRAEESHT